MDLASKFEKQVIHLHGSYKFYNCKNTNAEIDASSSAQVFESVIVDDFFSSLMPERMPIVIGYAGWSQDIFMKHLAKVAKRQQLQRNAYWFCYSANAINGLPKEITEHPNIRFVIDHEKHIDSVGSLEAIMAKLPTSTFSSTGGLFSVAVADLNGDSKRTKVRTDERSLSELAASEKPVEAISLNRKWTEPMILLQNGHSRDAWNLVVCGKLEPSNDAEAVVLLGVLAGVAKNLYYDATVVECAKTIADIPSLSEDFGSKTANEMRAVLSSLDAEDYEDHLMTVNCETCSMPIGIGLKVSVRQRRWL